MNSNELPSMVTNELTSLTADQQQAFEEVYARRRKATLWAYVTWAVGFHYAYIEGRWAFNFLYLLGSAATLGVWPVVELFRVRGRLRHQRTEAAIGALRDLRAVTATAVPIAV